MIYFCFSPQVAGIKTSRLVEAHGSFSTASCTICHARHDSDEVKVSLIIVI